MSMPCSVDIGPTVLVKRLLAATSKHSASSIIMASGILSQHGSIMVAAVLLTR